MKRLTLEEFIEKAKKVHGDKYDYSKVEYVNNRTKVIIDCLQGHEFLQTPHDHLKSKGCRKCGIVRRSGFSKSNTKEFIEKAKKVHGDKYNYSKVEYVNSITRVIIVCKNGHEFLQRPSCHLQGDGCSYCKFSKGEEKVRVFLALISISFISQKRFLELGRFSFDFYLPNLNLLIEFDGRQHFKHTQFFKRTRTQFRASQKRDLLKTKFALDNGYNLLRIHYSLLDQLDSILTACVYDIPEQLILMPVKKYKYLTKHIPKSERSGTFIPSI